MAKTITLTNQSGMVLSLSSFGASIVDITLLLPNGERRTVSVHPQDENDFQLSAGYYGKTIGRTAGRIADGRFSISNQNYQIIEDEIRNGLHGGSHSLAFVNFAHETFKTKQGQGVMFSHIVPHLFDGFPGNLQTKITYFLSDHENRLHITFEAISDCDTLVNLTNHTYFNLDGKGTILNHLLNIPADKYLTVDNKIMPQALKEVVGPTDFRKGRLIGDGIKNNELMTTAGGYDHPFILNNNHGVHPAAILTSSNGDIRLRMYTTYPVVVFYSGNYPTPEIMNTGRVLNKYEALALEPQFLPDAINNAFEQKKTGLLRAGEKYYETIEYCFDVK